MMVSQLENAKRALLQKLTADQENTDFLRLMEDFFASEITLNASGLELSNKEISHINTRFLQLEDKFKKDIDYLHVSSKENIEKLETITSDAKLTYTNKIQELDQQFTIDKEHLDAKLQQYELQYKQAIKTYQNEYNKTLNSIKKQIESIKTNHRIAIQSIENSSHEKLHNLELIFKEKQQLLHSKKESITQNFNERLSGLQNVRYLQSKAHDDDYITIKTHYNQLLKSLNFHINQLKGFKEKAINTIQSIYQEKQIPIIESLKHYESQVSNDQVNLKRTLEDSIARIEAQKEIVTKDYEENLKTIHASTAQSVSLLNSKLSNFRELTEVKKKELIKAFHTKSEIEKYKDVSNKNQQLRLYDNELNTLILSIRKQIKTKKLEGELLIFELNKRYQTTLNELFYELKRHQLEYTQSLKRLQISLLHHQKHAEDKQYRVNQIKKQLLTLLDVNYQKELIRFETQLAIAIESQERDLNQLSQDVFIDITSTDVDIEELKQAHQLQIFDIDQESTLLELTYRYDISVIDMESQRQFERENMIKTLLLEEQTTREQLSENIQKRQVLDDEKSYQHAKSELTKENQILDLNYQYDIILLKLDVDFNVLKRDFSKQEHHTKVSLRRSQMYLNYEQSKHTLTLEKQYSSIKDMIKTSLNRQQLTQKLKSYVTILYDKPAHPETIRQFLNFYAAYVEEIYLENIDVLSQCQESVITLNTAHIEESLASHRHALVQTVTAHYDDSKVKISELEHELNKKLYTLEINIKQQKDLHAKEDSLYLKLKKDKTNLMLEYDRLDKAKESKIQHIDRKILSYKHQMMRYVHQLTKLFDALKIAQKHYYKHHSAMIKHLQSQLYITKTILDQQLKSASKHDELYHQKHMFYQQSLVNILLLQHQHMHFTDTERQSKQEFEFNQSLAQIKNQFDSHLAKYHQEHLTHKTNQNQMISELKQKYALEIKDQETTTIHKHGHLSKIIAKDESTLQNFGQYYQKNLDYFDLNTLALLDKLEKSHRNVLEQKQKQANDTQVNQNQLYMSSIDQYKAKIKTTELNIENKLNKYRQKVSKLKESLHAKEHIIQTDLTRTKKVHVQKVVGSKQRTKKLLNKQQKEMQHVESQFHQQTLNLIKYSQQRLRQNIKAVSRGYRFKSRMMDLS